MIVPSMGLGSILPAGPWTIQKMTNDLLSLHGYIAQLNDAIQASSADQGFKDRWGVFATEWNSFKDNAASYAGVWSSSDTLAKVKDYQARVDAWKKQAEAAGVTTPGPVPNVNDTPPNSNPMSLEVKIILGVLGVAVIAGGAYVASTYVAGRRPAWAR
jgi:hypothetical protein